MNYKRKLNELTIKDNFMFGAVMADEENCRRLLELVLGISIGRVKVSMEKSIVYHPEYKGVRLDVYVIFICDFDPFGMEKYQYTFRNLCLEDEILNLQDGCTSIFLNTRGKNTEDVPKALVRFLDFVRADLQESMKDFDDAYIMQLQNSIRRIKNSREMEERFMILQEMLKEERAEGKAEAILVLLQELGDVSGELSERIMNEKNPAVLDVYLKHAAKAESLEDFIRLI